MGFQRHYDTFVLGHFTGCVKTANGRLILKLWFGVGDDDMDERFLRAILLCESTAEPVSTPMAPTPVSEDPELVEHVPSDDNKSRNARPGLPTAERAVGFTAESLSRCREGGCRPQTEDEVWW